MPLTPPIFARRPSPSLNASWMPEETPSPTPYASASYAPIKDPELSWMDYIYQGNVDNEFEALEDLSRTPTPTARSHAAPDQSGHQFEFLAFGDRQSPMAADRTGLAEQKRRHRKLRQRHQAGDPRLPELYEQHLSGGIDCGRHRRSEDAVLAGSVSALGQSPIPPPRRPRPPRRRSL